MKPEQIVISQITANEEPVEIGAIPSTLAEISGATSNPAIGLAPGDDRYQLQRRLGHGAMGEVFAAKDIFLRRRVAFKRMNVGVASSPQLATRFLNEAQITAQLEHPNIIPIYGLEATKEGVVAYAMKFTAISSTIASMSTRPCCTV